MCLACCCSEDLEDLEEEGESELEDSTAEVEELTLPVEDSGASVVPVAFMVLA